MSGVPELGGGAPDEIVAGGGSGETHHRHSSTGRCLLGLLRRLRLERRRFNDQHRQLHTLSRLLHEALEADDRDRAAELALHFQAAFLAHTSVEERILFPALHGLAPQLEPDLAKLVQDHREYEPMLRDFCRKLSQAGPGVANASLMEAWLAVKTELGRHERFEEEITGRELAAHEHAHPA